MRCKVFVSCGQHTPEEKDVARDISSLLIRRGFQPYLAIDVQTIPEINARIIRELKDSDCYLLVNFRREKIGDGQYRGSLFSNQELAIAYAFGFERLLIVNQDGVESQGMLRYIGINTETFREPSECCGVVERAIDRARWTTQYSRRLRPGELRFSELLFYGDLSGHFLYLDIQNDRPDIAALEATARLSRFAKTGEPLQVSPIRSPLKATGRPGFSHTIFPQSHESFDLLCIGNIRDFNQTTVHTLVPPASGGQYQALREPLGVYLNCALDVFPIPHLPIRAGVWTLQYEFFAIDFPILEVLVELTVTPTSAPQARIITEGGR